MIRKQSQEEENLSNSNINSNIISRIQRLQGKSVKMYQNIQQIISKTIQAIQQCQQSFMKPEENNTKSLMNLHIKMTQIKPLKSIKDEYNDFYKKLSGFGKTIQQMPGQSQFKIKSPKLFQQKDIKSIQQSLSDHYLSLQNYQAALSIAPQNAKRALFQECFSLTKDILQGKFDRPAEWVQKNSLNGDQSMVAYQIHKMKVICLVRQNKADEAIAYLRKNLGNYSNTYGNQISKLMNFIITQSTKFWGSETEYTGIYKNRYNAFQNVSLEQLAEKFTQIFFKKTKIYLINPISKCYEVGLKFRDQFLQHLKYLPKGQDLPAILPFSIKTGPQHKYHSYFYCPVNKQVFSSVDKNIVLGCGHMVSGLAINKITEARDSRRKMKCPICQSDQALENNIKVEF